MRVVRQGDGEIIRDSAEGRAEILSDHPSANVTLFRFAPRREGAALHVHRSHTDCFFVLDGELELRIGPEGTPKRLGPGELAKVPPLVVHGFANTSDADARFLNCHLPGKGFADFMRGLRDGEKRAYDQFEPPDDGGRDPRATSVGSVVDPFRIEELGPSDPLRGDADGCCAFILEGTVEVVGESYSEGAWLELDGAEAVSASDTAKLLVLTP